jgi:tRNA(Leu) C34 or U34 (ribose-2'-O)-methylase TrmL
MNNEFVHQRHKPPSALARPRELVLVCAPLRSNVNFSRIVRAAGCAGVARIIAAGHAKVDPEIARIPAEQIQVEIHRSLPPILPKLKQQGFALVGLEQTTNSVSLYEFAFPRRTALIVGNERQGLTEDVLAAVDHVVEIPVSRLRCTSIADNFLKDDEMPAHSSNEIDAWARSLSDPDVAVRRAAVAKLMRAGTDAQSAAVSLIQAVADSDEEVATQASEALENLGPPTAGAVEGLVALLTHDHSDCGYWAATLLGRLRADAASAVPALCSVIRSAADLSVRERAAWALGKIGIADQGAVETLEQAMRGDSPRLTRLARESREQLGE